METSKKSKKRKKQKTEDASTFFNFFSDEVQFSMITPFLSLSDGNKIRLLCRLGRHIVSHTYFSESVETTYDAVKFKACFARATAVKLESKSGKLRDFPLESITSLRLKVFDNTPLRLFDRCPNLESLEIVDSVKTHHVHHMLKRLPPSVWTFHGCICQHSLKYLSKVEGMISLLSSYVTSLEGLHPNLFGLNICGCYYLNQDALEKMPCLNLNCLNVSYTHLSTDSIRRMKCAATLSTIAFGYNCSIDDQVFDYLPKIVCVFIHAASNPFSEIKLKELKR